ncbi:uncharacterized protein LOC110664392 isoform X2 [Hevea brasiliensis]|uniref:uncharacterized protein LOC110664392 isoform X2 n=1 Tax=Hevea brasiliensis TaxID=3981 RepID=UPI0025DE1920|nr:uncharacterized protein LOC110664392 isoform X2 [Hevea brasiliensis]
MAKVSSFPMILYSTKLVSNLPLLIPQARNSHNPIVHEKNLYKRRTSVVKFESQFLHQPLVSRRFSSRHKGFNAKSNLESGEEDKLALETVLKLYTAIKNKNIHELSDIVGDECRCVCNFFSFFQSFNGKQQVLDFFNYVIRILGNNIEFAVQPTLHNGMNVGVSWKLQWTKTHMPLGKGFSFYICQIYQGKECGDVHGTSPSH